MILVFNISLTKKDKRFTASISGIKTEEKVYERVGRLKQKYPSISRYYQIDYSVEKETIENRKKCNKISSTFVY